MHSKIALLLLITYTLLYADDINEYLNEYKSTGNSDFKKEIQILEKYSYQKLTDKLNPFYNDSIPAVRQKAYYLTYRKGISSNNRTQQKTVLKLLSACNDNNGGVVGSLYSYLDEFPLESFDENAKKEIANLLVQKKAFHFKKLAMLAGKLSVGKEILQKKFLNPDTNNETKWIISLSLARQGSNNHINYCMERIKKVPVNSDAVSYLIPDLIYTRQHDAINFCVEIIFSNKKDCYSPNPDKPESILCAYRVMELITPVIIDFPFQIDATGSLVTNNYDEALIITRKWFNENPNYQIRQ